MNKRFICGHYSMATLDGDQLPDQQDRCRQKIASNAPSNRFISLSLSLVYYVKDTLMAPKFTT